MTSIKFMSKEHKIPYWYNSETKKSVWDTSKDNDKWIRYISTKYAKKSPYWHNSVTNESIWEITKEEKLIIPKNPKYKRSYCNDEYKEYAICNGNGISTTIRATDKYDAMEQMRDIAQSLNPYD
jgi:hypothetical protein